MNNRQAGRRRGRGGQRSQGGNPNQQGNGNRIDNRARGNAAQLLEKYKNMARDAQMQGDRVNTEYYLQFADHYFRVLNESRARFEEQNRRQRDDAQDDEDQDDGIENESEGEETVQMNGADRGNRAQHYTADRESDEDEAAEEKPSRRRTRRPRQEAAEQDGGEAAIEADRLPPALAANDGDSYGDDEAPKPRRRRRVRSTDEEAVSQA